MHPSSVREYARNKLHSSRFSVSKEDVVGSIYTGYLQPEMQTFECFSSLNHRRVELGSEQSRVAFILYCR